MKYFLLALLLATVFALPQSIAQTPTTKPTQHKALWLQYNPFNWAEPDIIVAATLLRQTNNYWAWATDVGVYVGRQNYNNEYFAQSGFRLRPEIRHYFDGQRPNKTSTLYVAFQGLLKYTSSGKQRWLDVRDSNGNLLFSELKNYNENRLVLGINFNLGVEAKFSADSRWMVDIFGGGGFRKKSFSTSGLPPGEQPNFNNNGEGRAFNIFLNGWYPSLTLGAKISYRL